MAAGTAPTLEFERALAAKGRVLVAGCDEVGRGSLAGPVSVGVVVIDPSSVPLLDGVRDSKLLSAPVRDALVPQISAWALASGVGHASAAEIDAIGLMDALRLAGSRALDAIAATGVVPSIVLLDGNHDWLSIPAQPALLFDGFGSLDGTDDDGGPAFGAAMPVVTKIKADMTCLSVAAASVLAKVERDGIMAALDEENPQFGWGVNKGYATAAHRAAITEHGPTDHHRKSWRLTA
ncbi:ribonuclease HII [Arthrobacter sp. 35W]|uniref:ribonuclease HII n=1 Tax=Arthrobacter sp. 35W TaxID=1132441 RepID=UPI000426A63C|nr:ribonuclease HII [Arthrobacter sp. 35W]